MGHFSSGTSDFNPEHQSPRILPLVFTLTRHHALPGPRKQKKTETT